MRSVLVQTLILIGVILAIYWFGGGDNGSR